MTEEEEVSKGRTLVDGLSIHVSEETTGKLSDGILDLFSPLIHGMGIVGDHLRFHREKVVIKAGKRVTELIGPDEDINPVPPKLFVPWLESVSLEDLDDDTMIDAWASVLARASVDFNPQMPSYLKVLEQMMPPHADLMREIALANGIKGENLKDDLAQSARVDQEYVSLVVENTGLRCANGQELEESLKAYENTINRPGTLLIYASYERGAEKTLSHYSYVPPKSIASDDPIPTLTVLENLGLIRTYFESSRDKKSEGNLFVILATLTLYGEQFSQSCIPDVVEAMKAHST